MKRLVVIGLMMLVWLVACQPSHAQLRPQKPPAFPGSVLPGANCPPGYIVNGRFVPKAEFLATAASPAKPSLPGRPGEKSRIPFAKLPVITGIAWVFPSQGVEIHGTDFTEFYCPSSNLNCRNTTPQLIVNGAPFPSAPYGASAVVASQIQQPGCYTFVLQRKVPVSQGAIKGDPVFTEGPGPQSVPYQEFVFVPKRVLLDGVQPLLATLDQPLGYQIIGKVQDSNNTYAGFGRAIADLKVVAVAASGQRLADGTPGRTIPPDHIQVVSDNAIVVHDELVQGDTIHFIMVHDAHYGDIQSNSLTATLPRRLVIQQVTPAGSGYVITGPNFGSDVNQLRLVENSTAVPQQNLSLSVLTGINTNTIQLTVANSTASGQTTLWLSTLVPGIAQRRVTVTLPPRP